MLLAAPVQTLPGTWLPTSLITGRRKSRDHALIIEIQFTKPTVRIESVADLATLEFGLRGLPSPSGQNLRLTCGALLA